MNIKDLKEGEIYLFKYSNITYINKIIDIDNKTCDAIGIDYNGYYKNQQYGIYVIIEEATPEQKHWLLECEKADKFISYDEAMKTFVKDFVLPEKWCIKNTDDIIGNYFNKMVGSNYGTYTHIYHRNKYLHSHNERLEELSKSSSYSFSNNNIREDFTEITLEQFKKYVLKEKQLPYTILKQEGDKILQVANSEGSVFDIGDYVKSLNSQQKGKITGFKYSVDKTKIISLTEFQKNGISIDKIEHYIQPITEEEFVLPEIWWVRVTNENKDVLSKWRFTDSNNKLVEGKLTGIYRKNRDNKLQKGHNPVHLPKDNDPHFGYDFGNEITFEQFKKYVLKEVEQPEESLLDKAKRLYPVGTKFINCGRFKTINTVYDPDQFQLINDNMIWAENGNGCIFLNGVWAEIVK